MKILVADDDATSRELALAMIRRLGHEAQVVTDGRAAVEAALSGAFDVVLLDLQMPELDGLEAAREIRARDTSGARPRLVAVTGSTEVADIKTCSSAGIDAHLAKPLRLDRLARVLTQLSGGGGSAWEPASHGHTLDELRESIGDAAVLAVADRFLQGLPGLLAELQDPAGNPDGHVRAIHKIAGLAGLVGAVELSARCRTAEQQGPSPADVELIAEQIDALRGDLERFRNDLESDGEGGGSGGGRSPREGSA